MLTHLEKWLYVLVTNRLNVEDFESRRKFDPQPACDASDFIGISHQRTACNATFLTDCRRFDCPWFVSFRKEDTPVRLPCPLRQLIAERGG